MFLGSRQQDEINRHRFNAGRAGKPLERRSTRVAGAEVAASKRRKEMRAREDQNRSGFQFRGEKQMRSGHTPASTNRWSTEMARPSPVGTSLSLALPDWR